MFRFISVLMLLGFTAGCDPFVELETRFAVYNSSSYDIQTVVNGNVVGTIIGAGGTASFRVLVPIPRQSGGSYSTEPSVDREVSVTVAFQNLSTGWLSQMMTCRAGAKIVTSVSYEVSGTEPYLYENTQCSSSW